MTKVLDKVLIQYVEANDIVKVERTLKLHASPNVYNQQHKHLLEIAVETKNRALVNLLLSHFQPTSALLAAILEKITNDQNALMLETIICSTTIKNKLAHEFMIKTVQNDSADLLKVWVKHFASCSQLVLHKRTPMQHALYLGRTDHVDIMTNALIKEELHHEFYRQQAKALHELKSYYRWCFKKVPEIEVAIKHLTLATTPYDAQHALYNIIHTQGLYKLKDKWVKSFSKLKDDTERLRPLSSSSALLPELHEEKSANKNLLQTQSLFNPVSKITEQENDSLVLQPKIG